MRTTVRLEDRLLADAKQFALERGTTLTAVIDRALRDLLRTRHDLVHAPRMPLPTFCGNGLQPGVDLDDSASLLDLMDEPG